MKSSTVWISYDLGISGDYESLYAWLDSHDAKECGDALAVLAYEHDGSLIDKLRADLKKNVKTDKRSRIYVIYRDPATNKNKGTFLVRRQACCGLGSVTRRRASAPSTTRLECRRCFWIPVSGMPYAILRDRAAPRDASRQSMMQSYARCAVALAGCL